METKVPPQSIFYSYNQHTVWKFYHEYLKFTSHYQKSLTGFQLEWLKSLELMMNPSISNNCRFNNKTTLHSPKSSSHDSMPLKKGVQRKSKPMDSKSNKKDLKKFLNTPWPLL